MNQDHLVRRIAEEVLRRLREQKPCALVLAERSDELVRQVRACLGAEVEIVFRGEERGLEPEMHILPVLSCADMADLAVGRAGNKVLNEVLALLLAGKTVCVLDYAYLAHAATAPGPLLALYQQHEKTLASFGLTRLAPKGPQTVRLRRDVVTEQDVLQAVQQGAIRVLVPAAAKNPPRAAEPAATMHISIIKEG